MSYIAHQKDFGPHACAASNALAAPVATEPATGWSNALRRLLGRMFEPQDRQLERELGEFIARSGGSLTDNLEREMMQRITHSGIGTWR